MTELGILAVWNDADPAGENEFGEWYEREHLPERVGVPGFRFGRRYRNLDDQASPRYFTFYETDSLSVLASPDYLERLNNPTEWTQRMMPVFRDMHRSACHIRAQADDRPADRPADGAGEYVAVTTLAEGREIADALPGLVAADGVVRAQLWQADPWTTDVDAVEMSYRDGKDRMADWILIVEAATAEALDITGLPGESLGRFRLISELASKST